MATQAPREASDVGADRPPAQGQAARPAPRGGLRAGWWAAAAVGLLLAAGLASWQLRPSPRELTGGALLSDRPPAADFTLTDQLGRAEQLSGLRGRPVALTFLYTRCPDVCPLIASNLHTAYRELGEQAGRVALVAVTVDPERDGVEQLRQFSDQRGLTDEWLFLTGSRPELEAVWRAYNILAEPVDAAGRPISPAARRAAGGQPPDPAEVEHAAPIYLIDKQGRLRAMLPVDVTPATLVADLRLLLTER